MQGFTANREDPLQCILNAFSNHFIFISFHDVFHGFAAQATSEALQNFYRSRMPRVAGISLLSGLASDLIINAPWSPNRMDVHSL